MPSLGKHAYGSCMGCGIRLSKQNNTGYCRPCFGPHCNTTPGTRGHGRWQSYKLFPLDGVDCERCGNPATDRHHIDGDVCNNHPSNVELLCISCHTTQTLSDRWADPEYRKKQVEANRRTAKMRVARSGSIQRDKRPV